MRHLTDETSPTVADDERQPRTRRLVNGNYDPSRSIRVPDDVWERLHARAHNQGISGSYALSVLARLFVEGQVSVSTVDTHGGRSRSVRISHEVYIPFQKLAKDTGLTTAGALATLARMYADDEITIVFAITATQRFP